MARYGRPANQYDPRRQGRSGGRGGRDYRDRDRDRDYRDRDRDRSRRGYSPRRRYKVFHLLFKAILHPLS